MADADVPIPAASEDRRIEATRVSLSYFADLTGNIGSHGTNPPFTCRAVTNWSPPSNVTTNWDIRV